MAETFHCPECGADISVAARFCRACGAPQEPAETESPHAPPPERAARDEHPGRLSPLAAEFAAQLGAVLRAPGVAIALLGGLLGALACIAAGLLVAAVLPDASLVGLRDDGIVEEAFGQAVGFLLTPFRLDGETVRFGPALFVAFPVVACALANRALAGRARDLSTTARLVWAAATGVPFGLLMLVCALAAGRTQPSASTGIAAMIEVPPDAAFFLGLLWGALGGTLGALAAIRAEERELAWGDRPSWLSEALGVGAAALRPLGAVLLVSLVAGTLIWVVQALRDAGGIARGRSTVVAIVDHAVYGVDHGVHVAELSAGVAFRNPGESGALGLPLPVDDVRRLEGPEYANAGTFRILDYNEALPIWAFLALLGLMLVPLVAALYAGFSVARPRAGPSLALGAAWGAVVGPAWALSMVLLDALVQKQLLGRPVGDSVFTIFLFGGAAVGALGGLLAAQAGRGEIRPEPAA